ATLLLTLSSLFLSYLLAIPLGLYATARNGRLDERTVSVFLYMLYSLPSFVAALALQMLFAIRLHGTAFELPLFGMTSDHFEQIFSWPGMGKLFFESIRMRDYPTLMGLLLMFSVLTLIGQLLADILYAVVDPRVSYK